MSYTQSHPDGEIIPPTSSTSTVAGYAPPEAYSPEQARKRREYSVWDPRSAPGTYFLLAINIAVYLWMITHGVNPKEPSEAALINYGANHTWLVLHGEWYRLLTATFVHVGLLHLATNMWCLWNLGILGEPLLGPFGMVAVYMVTGIAGILIVLLSNRLLPFPWEELRRLRSSVVKFALINLVIGLSTMFVNVGIRIDNSAHIGGFLSGMALGLPLVPRMTAGRERYLRRQKITFALSCFILALIGYFIAHFA
jgi:rhomboid protease GluP